MTDLLSLFDDLDRVSGKREAVVRAPFNYAGSKSTCLKHIMSHLPYTNTYIEPFGGSGSLLLARKRVNLEVLNDRYMGIVSFYCCLQHPDKFQRLIERLDLTVYSREDFIYCRDTWENEQDDVERAAKWFYMIQSSFASLGRNWGRSVTSNVATPTNKISKRIKIFAEVHNRLRGVQIENQDWEQCIIDYDTPETVFYIDPPYISTDQQQYKQATMNAARHFDLLNLIHECKGFVALSGHSENLIYDKYDWDNRIEFEVKSSVRSTADNSNKLNDGKKGHRTEVLWIKEARQ